ncbi:MAG: type II toxin-antitoxin system VapC family toxin [Kiritimatiellae bacterium]|nr:type II toxin-antitoxin system VapC family toxin [Kiritimatiellia bacterium]
MRLLLDTQIALWAITDSPRLSADARSMITDSRNDLYFSAATVWEISIKHGLARGNMPVSGREASELFSEAGYLELPISSVHAAATEELPDHHADPFDRILVAQAISEPLRLLTHDKLLTRYGDMVEFV